MEEKTELYGLKQVSVRLRLQEAEPLYSTEAITDSDRAVQVMSDAMADLDREYCCVVSLDARKRPISYSVVSIGDTSSAQIPIQNLFKAAILQNSSSLICLHNHPAGSLEPSRADQEVTKRMVEAGRIIGIPIIDHIIVAGGTGLHTSIRNTNPELFEGSPLSMVAGEGLAEEKSEGYKSKVAEMTKKLEEGVAAVFESDKYKTYLNTVSRFHGYSVNNTILIALQKPDASYVAGYSAWRDTFHRQVKYGEKGLTIIAPYTYKKKAEEMGDAADETEEIEKIGFKTATVFDVSQTEGEPLPTLVTELADPVKDYLQILDAIRDISPVNIRFTQIDSNVKGFYSHNKQEIQVKHGMSEEQSIKTAIHEVAHARLRHGDKDVKLDRKTMEVQAESVAYCCCQALGIDTADYSFGYVAGWSSGKDTKELKKSLEVIRDEADKMIKGITEKLALRMEAEKVKREAPKMEKSGRKM